MSQRKFDHFSNGSPLFSASSDIVIADIIKLFLILAIDWLSFSVEHGVRSNYSELFGLSCYNFELNWLEVSSNDEKISFLHWSVSIFEVRDEVGFCEISLNALDGVCKGQDVDFGEIWDISCCSDLHNISKSYSEVFADCFVHPDFRVFELVINQSDN